MAKNPIRPGMCVVCKERSRERGKTRCGPCQTAYVKGLGKRSTEILAQDRLLEVAADVALEQARAEFERLEAKRRSDIAKLRKLGDPEKIARLQDLQLRVLEHITDEDLAEAALRDKAVVLGIAIDKELVLSGRPTQVLGIEERRAIKDLVPGLLAEARRRGLTIEAAAVDVTPGAA